ncbi:hypothetical protein ACP70R_014727 [Stipagrostis hirtigluma subsp. patula]
MDLDPEGMFRDDSDEEDESQMLDCLLEKQERETNKEMVVYLIDASPKMFTPATTQADENQETHFHTIVNCITQSLKTQIIGRSYDEVAICFFNTKEKKNLQDLAGVYVYNSGDREDLDRPTAKLIKDFSSIEDSFMSNIGSRYGITAGSRENTLYNALWVAQALLRKGSVKTVSKRILIFTNEDDPFGAITGAVKTDMIRTTVQRAKDAQDLGLYIELLPLSRPDEHFNMSLFYADLIGLEGDEIAEYLPSAGEKLQSMTDQLRRRMMKKRRVKTLSFAITNDVCIEVNTYALIRPTAPGTITWLDSLSNLPLKAERSFICNDTGALLQDPQKRFQLYNDNVARIARSGSLFLQSMPGKMFFAYVSPRHGKPQLGGLRYAALLPIGVLISRLSQSRKSSIGDGVLPACLLLTAAHLEAQLHLELGTCGGRARSSRRRLRWRDLRSVRDAEKDSRSPDLGLTDEEWVSVLKAAVNADGKPHQSIGRRIPPPKIVKFSVREISEVKRVSSHHLRLLGFKPLDYLKDYHNLRPSTFIYPSDEHIFGSTRVFVALHSSMLRLGRFALAFYGNPTRPQLVALVAQEEVISPGVQVEPPGMHMIYLPYSNDMRYPEEFHLTSDDAPRATDEQIKKASNLLKRIDLKDFSVCQFANPALQKHYGILEALALGEDEMPDIKDDTLPDQAGLLKLKMSTGTLYLRPGVVKAIEEFKASVYGENYDQEEAEAAAGKASRGEASKKRKAITDAASQRSADYNWAELADNGKLKDMTVVELKSYLTAHDLPVSGKKEALISRILTHLGK